MYLTSCRDSRRGLGCPDFEILLSLVEILGEFLAAEIFRSRWDLGENLDEILRSRRESRRVFGRRDFKISPRSRQDSRRDLKILLRSWRESRRVLGRRDFEILPRSRRDLTEISAISPAKNSPRFSPRSWSKFYQGLEPWESMLPIRVEVGVCPYNSRRLWLFRWPFLGVSGGMLPQKIFKIRSSEMRFPAFLAWESKVNDAYH